MTRGGGKVSLPAGRPRSGSGGTRLARGLAAPRSARPPSPGARFFPPPNSRGAPSLPQPPARRPSEQVLRRGAEPGRPDPRPTTGREGAPGEGTGGHSRDSYGAQFLPEQRPERQPSAGVRPPPPPPPPALPAGEGRPSASPQPTGALGPEAPGTLRRPRRGVGATPSAARLGRDPRRSASPASTPGGRRSRCPPGAPSLSPLTPRPTSAAPTLAPRFLPGSSLGPGNVPGESGRSGHRPPRRSLSSLRSLTPAP
ncbi:proline-rich protein 2-like [Talpa occidentalis]|uniref:proline-rich protein 2-like n=1 Tax=Talpa occidentalis TaxID=50954 RepID=UPI0018901958|nr:proline-rich protein 2-like [Talpa occidentalis]